MKRLVEDPSMRAAARGADELPMALDGGGDKAGILAAGEAWKETVRAVAWHWMARAFPAGWAAARPGTAVRPNAFKLLLLGAGFTDVEIRSFAEPRDWTFDEIVGYLRSTSVCSEGALGDLFSSFEAA
jgi:hypothetical protein